MTPLAWGFRSEIPTPGGQVPPVMYPGPGGGAVLDASSFAMLNCQPKNSWIWVRVR